MVELTGLPAIIRPSFTLGGTGGGIVYNMEEFEDVVSRGLDLSPMHEILVEESVLGWKEYELEVMRDGADNFVVICSIENFDPMGIHTGDSVTVAPAQTLTDVEYQKMRNAARMILREVGVETGGSNMQFAVDPKTGRMVVIEMNPRVSRSSALASKATGFPIAKIAALLAIGYRLDEIKNDITKVTPACFEPVLDYVVVKIPRWAFEKFRDANPLLGTQMKSVGEVMTMGRTFKEALHKALRGLEIGTSGFNLKDLRDARISEKLLSPDPDRIFYVKRALDLGWDHAEINRMTGIDMWFLDQIQQIVDLEKQICEPSRAWTPDVLREAKRLGSRDARLAQIAARACARPTSAPAASPPASSPSTSAWTPAPASSSPTPRTCTRPTRPRTSPRPPTARRSSSSAAAPTASGRASSSTTAAATPRSPSRKRATRRS